MLALSLSAVGLLGGSAPQLSNGRACVRAAVAEPTSALLEEAAAPDGFYWGLDTSNPNAELVVPPPSISERLAFGGFDKSTATISLDEVTTAQNNWAKAISTISKVHAEGGDFVGAAGTAAGELYGYGKTNVLFKPTKATAHPFRPTADVAMSYFVGAEAMGADDFKGEDAGFAINGGRGWSNVVFRNHQVDLNGPTAQAMGDYIFTDATSGDEVRVEYTFGYKRNDDGKVRIYLHHSSVPYSA